MRAAMTAWTVSGTSSPGGEDRRDPAARVRRERARSIQDCEHLLDEERVALGALGTIASLTRAGRPPASTSSIRSASSARQRLEPDPRDVACCLRSTAGARPSAPAAPSAATARSRARLTRGERSGAPGADPRPSARPRRRPRRGPSCGSSSRRAIQACVRRVLRLPRLQLRLGGESPRSGRRSCAPPDVRPGRRAGRRRRARGRPGRCRRAADRCCRGRTTGTGPATSALAQQRPARAARRQGSSCRCPRRRRA